MTELHATPRAIERRLVAALDALIQRDARIAATVLRVTGDRALTSTIEDDQRAVHADLFDVLLAVRNLPRQS